MEDSKKFFKFFGKEGEDFALWSARTEAALESKECFSVVQRDVFASLGEGEPLPEAMSLKVAKAKAIIIQGLGDKPLRACISDRANPHRMWARLCDRYAVASNAARVQLQSRLARMRYSSQSMGDYLDSFEEIFNRLSGMNSQVDESLQVAMLLASFGEKTQSDYGHVIATIQGSTEDLTWDSVAARLLQEYEEKSYARGTSTVGQKRESGFAKALSVGSKTSSKRKENRRCYGCGKKGHLAKDCWSKNMRSSSTDSREERIATAANSAVMLMTVSTGDEREVISSLPNLIGTQEASGLV